MNFLQEILTDTRRRVAVRRARRPLTELERIAADHPKPPDFTAALRRPGIRIIAELKCASPSRGVIRKEYPVAELAVFKGESGVLTPVTNGLPAKEDIASLGTPYSENGVAYIPVVTTDGSSPALYKIDPVTASATKGLTIVTNDNVQAVGKLTSF